MARTQGSEVVFAEFPCGRAGEVGAGGTGARGAGDGRGGPAAHRAQGSARGPHGRREAPQPGPCSYEPGRPHTARLVEPHLVG